VASILVAIVLLVVRQQVGSQQQVAELPTAGKAVDRDCGARCLFFLAHIEGQPVTLAKVASALPSDRTGHFSLAELRDASAKLGLALNGVRLTKSAIAPDRPAVVYLKRGPHGHFAVVRPVGHSGKLVQVIDPSREPFVVDATALYASPEWTGLALVPDRPVWGLRIIGFVGLGVGTAWIVGSLIVRRRGRGTCPPSLLAASPMDSCLL